MIADLPCQKSAQCFYISLWDVLLLNNAWDLLSLHFSLSLSLSLSLSHPVGWGSRSDSSGRDGHPFPSSPCFCSHQLHCPLLTKWAYLTPHPVAQMNNSPRRCTGEAQAGLHLTERGQWIMGLRRGAPLPACPRERTSNCSWARWSPALVEWYNAAGTIARIVYGKKQI